MKKIFLSCLLISLFTTLFFSCGEDTAINDSEPPVITDFRLFTQTNVDTLLYIGTDSNFFSARFTDDQGLSSFKIQISKTKNFSDTVFYNRGEDSATVKYVKSWGSVWAKDTAIITKQVFMIPSTVSFSYPQNPNTTEEVLSLSKTVKTGDYWMLISCMDMAGNTDSIYKRVRLIYPPITQSTGN